MADGFDPCECVWSHDHAMRRLLTLLRQSQGYCTDNECLQPGQLPGEGVGASDDGGNNMMFFMMVWTVMAMALFFLRPSSLRAQPSAQGKPRREDNQDNDNSDPSPPVN